MSGRDEWRWTDEQGVQRLVRTEELRAALASNVLPASTLVWREGMNEWLPAFTLPEFAGVAGPARRLRSTPPPGATPAPPKPRAPLQTLMGLSSPEGERPSGPYAPITVPHVDQGKTSGITQQPRFDGDGGGQSADVTIPRAPRLPTEEPKPTPASTPFSRTQLGVGTQEHKAGTRELASLWSDEGSNREENTSTDTLIRPDSKRPPGDVAASSPGQTGEDAPPKRPAPLEEVTADTDPEAGATLAASAARTPAAARPQTVRPRPPPVPLRKPNLAPLPTKPHVDATPAGKPQRPQGQPPKPLPMLSAKPATAPSPARTGPTSPEGAAVGPAAKQSKPPPPPIARAAKAAEAKPSIDAKTARAEPKTDARAPLSTSSIDLMSATSVPAPLSGPPALVGKLQAPSSSLPATGPSAAAQADKEPIHVGISTANMPAMVDPAAASWLAQTTTTSSGQGKSASKPSTETQPAKEAAALRETSTTAVMATVTTARASERPPPAGSASDRPPPMPSERPPSMGSASDRPPGMPSDRPPSFGADVYTLRPSQRPPTLREMVRPEHLSDPVQVPFSSLLGAAGTLIVMVVSAFLVGRCSIVADASAEQNKATTSLGLLPLLARAAVPPFPKPCWVARQPVMWAATASKNIPFELLATEKRTLAVGYAKNEREAIGIEVEPASGQVTPRFASDKLDGDVDRVSPSTNGETFHVSTSASTMRPVVSVWAPKPFVVGMAKDEIIAADGPDGAPAALWPAPRSDSKTLRAQFLPDHGTLVILRRDGGVFGGWLGPDRKPATGSLMGVVGSGGAVGKPMTGHNGKSVAVVYADRPSPGVKWQIRVGTAAAGKVPESTVVIPLPKGGPGGDAFAPDIAGLPDGRWLLVWTEGAPGSRAIRALTLQSDLTPIGDPIALSPPAGNFGQGALGVVGDYAATVFLQKGSSSYELWGAILQCG